MALYNQTSIKQLLKKLTKSYYKLHVNIRDTVINHLSSESKFNSIFSIKLATLATSVSVAMMVTGCSGFHLQGSQKLQGSQHSARNTAQNNAVQNNNTLIDNTLSSKPFGISNTSSTVAIQTAKGNASKVFKRQLINRLNNFGIQTIDVSSFDSTHDNLSRNSIDISNISFREYDLLGVLTEVRVVILADVTYHYTVNGQQKTHSQPIQIQRSYQHNKASVGTINQQQQQIKQWLYDTLAQRITNQYFALSQNNQ